jgi:ParB/RepB/Spo0J family partition protein
MKAGIFSTETRFTFLNTGDIDRTDRSFALSWPGERDLESLISSIKSSGLLEPVWVKEDVPGGKYRLIHGFRRLEAAGSAGLSNLPAFILDGSITGFELFLARLEGHAERLPAVEAARVLVKLEKLFSPGDEELVRTVLPLLGLGSSRKILEECRLLDNLEEQAAIFCAKNGTGLREASAWASFPPKGQLAILELVRAVTPGSNLLCRYLELLAEIGAREGIPVEEILSSPGISVRNLDSQTARSGARERIHKALRQVRYPVVKSIEERFRKTLSSLQLPCGLRIDPPAYLEGESLSVSFEVRSRKELEQKARKLLEASSRDEAGELFRCLVSTEEEGKRGNGD